MTKSLVRIILAAALLSFAAACDSDDSVAGSRCDDRTFPESSLKLDAGLHGERCQTDDECMYGTCYMSALTGGAWGICTKDCGCGDETTTCDYDNTRDGAPSAGYLCFLPDVSLGDTLKSYCVPECDTVDDCKAIDDAYTACKVPSGTRKVCTTDI